MKKSMSYGLSKPRQATHETTYEARGDDPTKIRSGAVTVH